MSTVVGYLVGERGEFSGLRVAIPEKGLVIGRDPTQVDVVFDHTMVSRRHAQIAPGRDGKLYLIDLQSRNGTHVNGRRITAPAALAAGDKLDFGGEGKAVFVFESADTTSVTGVLKEAFGETVAPVEWKVGDSILGIYEVTGILGQGGMGKVYKVHHRSWNIDLAVKSPLPGLFTGEKAVENFIREAETWVNLNLHPNIVQCYYVRTIGGIPRIFAEYVPGGTLHHWIAQKKLAQLDQILDVAIQFAWGIHAAHEQGVVHQDVKPANVLMTHDGCPKVTDFGLARSRPVSTDSTPADQNALVSFAGGTLAYISPEQAQRKQLSRKTDIWSWAVSVLHMFVGDVVWENGLQATEVLKAYRGLLGPKFIVKMPRELAKLLGQCLCARPDDRPGNMLEIANELRDMYQSARSETYPCAEPKAAEHLADSLNNRAVSFLDLGKEENALALWDEAIKNDPLHPESVFNSGLVRWRSAQIADDALVHQMTGVCAAYSGELLPSYLLALVHLERGDCESAIEVLSGIRPAKQLADEITALLGTAKRNLASSRKLVRTFGGHTDIVEAVFLSECGKYGLSGGRDCCAKIWDVEKGTCLRSLPTARDWVRSVCMSLDRRCVVSGDEGGTISLWDFQSGEHIRSFQAHKWAVTSLCTSPDSKYLLSGSDDASLKLWNWQTAQCLWTAVSFDDGYGHLYSPCLSPDGRYAVSGGYQNIRLWDAYTGRCLLVLKAHSNRVESVAWTGQGLSVISASLDGSARLLDLATAKCAREFRNRSAHIHSARVAGNGRFVLLGGIRELRMWELASGRCVYTFMDRRADGSHVAIGGGGKYALTASLDTKNVLHLWALGPDFKVAPAPLALSRASASETALKARFACNEALERARSSLAVGDAVACARFVRKARSQTGCTRLPEAVKLWTSLYMQLPRKALVGGWHECTLQEDPSFARSICTTQHGRHLISGGDGGLKLWDLANGQVVRSYDVGNKEIWAVATNRLGKYILAYGEFFEPSEDDSDTDRGERTLSLWELHTGCCLYFKNVDSIDERLMSLAVSQDMRWAISGGTGNTPRLWDVKTGECLRTFGAHESNIRSVDLSSDANLAVSADVSDEVKLWNVVTGECLQSFNGRYAALFASNDRTLIFLDRENQLMSVDIASTRCLWKRALGTNRMSRMYISSDGRFALLGGEKKASIWGLEAGVCLQTFEPDVDYVNGVCMSDDGRYAFVAACNGIIRVLALDWELEDKDPADWDEAARPWLENFLAVHTPYAGELPSRRQPTQEEITLALTRRGKPTWTESDFNELSCTLGCAGYGWLRLEVVRQELEKMARAWE